MRNRIAIPLILLLHLTCAIAYLCVIDKYSEEVAFIFIGPVTYEGLFSVAYFVPEGICCCLMVQAVRKRKLNWLQNQMVDMWIGFMLTRILIYISDDLNIYNTDSRERIIFILFYFLIMVVWVILNAYREGYLEND